MAETEGYTSGSDGGKDDSQNDYTVVNVETLLVGKTSNMKSNEGETKMQVKVEERKKDEKWKLPEIERFLGLYEMCPCLWDYKLPDYKDKNVREQAWLEIVHNMNKNDFTVQKAKEKIRILRNTYSNELIKIQKSKTSGVEDIYTPTLRWFSTMDRILGRVVQIRGSHSVGHSEKRSDTPRIQKEDVEKFKASKMEIADEIMSSSASSTAGRIEQEKRPMPRHKPLPYMRSSTKRTAAERLHEIENAVNKLKGIISYGCSTESTSMSDNNCEFDLFGKFVSSQLKRLPEFESLDAMQQIQNCLLQKRISVLKSVVSQPTSRDSKTHR